MLSVRLGSRSTYFAKNRIPLPAVNIKRAFQTRQLTRRAQAILDFRSDCLASVNSELQCGDMFVAVAFTELYPYVPCLSGLEKAARTCRFRNYSFSEPNLKVGYSELKIKVQLPMRE